MELRRKQPTIKGTSDHFIGDVWIDRLAGGDPGSRLRVNVVRFAPGARNAWHVHGSGQTLHVIEGIGRIQARGGEVLEIRAGDTAFAPAGEWHWHGAAPDHFMSHLAMWEAPVEGAEVQWGDHVSADDYEKPPLSRHTDSRC
jgi:quercetin dioxygenase-like cupin family protein